MADDIPSLTLRVLEKIQSELAAFREEFNGFRDEFNGFRSEVNTRFDHMLVFVGTDVQDLKTRVAVLEDHVGIRRTT